MAFIGYRTKFSNHGGMLVFLLVFLCTLRVGAMTSRFPSDTLYCDSVCMFTEKILFPKASAVVSCDFAGNQFHVDSICSFLSHADIRDFLSVKIIGSYSPEGQYVFNTKLAQARALALADVVKGFNAAVTPVTSITHPTQEGVQAYMRQRFAELQVVYRNSSDSTDDAVVNDTLSAVANELQVADDNAAVTDSLQMKPVTDSFSSSDSRFGVEPKEEIPLSPAGHASGSRLFLTTNLLYDAALVPNIGVGIGLTDRVTLLADWMYARWSNRDKRRYWRIYGGDVEARYRVGNSHKCSPLGGHHVGVYGSMACYDFQTGRDHRGVLSDKYNYAVGLSYTYSLPVASRLHIDFSLGVGYLWGIYKKHTPIDDCDVWFSTNKLRWFGPTRAGVSLVWMFGKAYNDRKGGLDR